MNFLQDLVCGTLSGVGNCLSGYIFDTLKVRMQMDPTLQMVSALRNIIKNQGFAHLFNGIYYPLITVPIVNAVIFSSYELYKKIRGKTQLSFIDGIENGAFAGLVNTIIVSPVELVKCRMQLDKENKFKSSHACLMAIIKEEGFRGVFRGSFSTAFRQIFAYAAQFATYEFLKEKIVKKEHPHLSFAEGLVVGTFAGLNCWIFSYPQDIIKTKIQVQELGKYKTFFKDGGFFDCGRHIYRENGLKGFFIGIEPCLIRAAIANAFGIAIYEQSQYYLTHSNFVKNY